MPWIDDVEAPQTVLPTGGPLPNPERPTQGETLAASFSALNPMVNLARKLFEESYPPEEGHNPMDLIRGTRFEEFHAENFVGSRSTAETRARMRQIEQEEADGRTREASGLLGAATDTLAGVLDPTLAFPGGAIARSLRGGYSVLRSGRNVAGAAGLQVGVQEAILQGVQETRSAEESAAAIGTATLLGGLIGAGAARFLSGAERKALAELVDAERKAMDIHAGNVADLPLTPGEVPPAKAAEAPLTGEPPQARAAGAAAARTDELVPVSYGFDKIPGWSRVARFFGTDLGIYSSRSVAARRMASDIFETTLRFKQNLDDQVTAPVVPLDRETRIVIERTKIQVGDELRQAYSEYFFGSTDARLPYVRAQFELGTGRVTDKLDPAAFGREVSSAMQQADTHAIPQVARAAQFIRRSIIEPYAQRMEAANPNFKRQEFGPGKSYFPYAWDSPKIVAERPDFVEKSVLPHLRAQQAQAAAAKARLETLNGELAHWNSEVGRFEDRLEGLVARQGELEARLDERAMEVARTETRAGIVEERAASIAEDLSEISDFVAAMRRELKDPALLARLDVMEKEASALRKADRAVTEADLRKIEKQEVDAILTGTTRMAAEMIVGRRSFPKAPSFVSWLVEKGGIKDVGGDVEAIVGGKRVRPGLLNKERGQSLDQIAEKIQEEARGHFPARDEPGGGRPDHRQILEWLDEALRGRDPDWWIESRSPATKETIEAGKFATALDEIFGRAGLEVRTIGDVGKLLRDGRLGEVTLRDLDRIAADMEAAGEIIPARLRRADVEERVGIDRESIAQARGMIGRALRARESHQNRLRTAEARGEEAAIAERANRGRLGILQDRLDRAEQRRELLKDVIEISGEARDRARARIEAEIAAWEGKTAGEAKAALKAREKQEGERSRGRVLAAESGKTLAPSSRLTQADDAIDRTVKRIIASDRDLSDLELRDKAEEITDHVLGTPIGRMPYDIHVAANERPRSPDRLARGPLLERDFNVPYELAKDWLSHDLDRVLGNWMRTMVPDTLLWERFPGEGPAMTSRYRQIQEEYAGLVRAATSAKERTRLNNEKNAVIETLDGVVQRIRGTTNNTEGLSGRIGENVRRINQMTDLGFAALTSIPDLAGPVFYHGFTSVLGDGWAPYASYLAGSPELLRMSNHELRSMAIAVEMENSTRGHALYELSDVYHPQSKAERALKFASDRYFTVNLQAQETNTAKRIAGRVAMANFLRAIKADAEGAATARQRVSLRESNVDTAMSKRIWGEFSKPDGGATIDGTMLSNTANWTDERARMHFTAAIARDVERAVVTPGQEKPIWLSTNAGGVLGQFKTFSIASGNKILISNLQRRDAQSLQGVVAAVGMGVLSYRLSTLIRGQQWPDRPQDAIKEGINRSGILGPLEDVNMFAAKASSGTVDIYRLIGADKPLSRNVNRTILSSLLGPTAGKIENIGRVSAAATATREDGSRAWSAGDTHALRRLIALQNVFYLNRAFDAVEKGFNSSLDIPPLPERR